MLRKYWAIVALLCLLLCACEPIPPSLPGEIGQTLQWQQFAYRIEADHTVTVLLYRGEAADVTVPATIEGLPVKAVGNNAFHGKQTLQRVTLEQGIEHVGNSAFNQCPALVEVNLPSTLKSIGNSAFNRCINLPAIALPQGLQQIGDLAFLLCEKLADITFPQGDVRIGGRAFDETAWLKAQSGHVIVGNVYLRYRGDQAQLQLPQGIEHIAGGAFFECKTPVHIVIPEGVADIGDVAFYGCDALERIDFPASLTAIGSDGFVSCVKLHYTAPSGSWAQQYADSIGIPVFKDAQ